MARSIQDQATAGLAAFKEAAEALMDQRGIRSDSELARMVKRVSRKTVNNALSGRHNAQIGTLEAIAGALGCPLWVMFLVGLESSDLQSPARERLIAMVNAYLACDDESRHHVESLASAFAAKAKK
jgi:transcriptional regulator with XRE-family HTH domain